MPPRWPTFLWSGSRMNLQWPKVLWGCSCCLHNGSQGLGGCPEVGPGWPTVFRWLQSAPDITESVLAWPHFAPQVAQSCWGWHQCSPLWPTVLWWGSRQTRVVWGVGQVVAPGVALCMASPICPNAVGSSLWHVETCSSSSVLHCKDRSCRLTSGPELIKAEFQGQCML